MAKQGKSVNKMNSAYILRIIEQYGSETKPLIIKDIEDHLRNEYGIDAERKSIQDTVNKLLEQFNIDKDENYYMCRAGRKSGVYMKTNAFEDPEIRLLIDSVIGNKHIKKYYAQDLINKLANLTATQSINDISLGKLSRNDNEEYSNEYFANIDKISEAITNQKAISFSYGSYQLKLDVDGSYIMKMKDRKNYVVSPYKMIVHNQHYYLICQEEGKSGLRSFRIDKMKKVKSIDNRYQEYVSTDDYPSIDSLDALSKLPFMSSSKLVNIGLKVNLEHDTINQLLDWFNKDDIKIQRADKKWAYCSVVSNEFAMLRWACLYIDDIVITSPDSLVDNIKKNLQIACRNYNVQ